MRAECGRALLLVERLADGETSSRERREAEDHLARCADCTAELQLLTAMTRHARVVPEPPPGYWEHLPRRILARLAELEREENRGGAGFWSRLFAPERLRWHALGATLVVLAALGATVLRIDPMEQGARPERISPPGEPSLGGSARPRTESVIPSEPEREKTEREPQNAPEMARDEARPSEKAARRIEPPPAAAPAPPAEEHSKERAATAGSGVETRSQTARPGEERSSDAESLRSAAPIDNVPADPCEELRQRRFVQESTGIASAEARYELAACSLARFEAEPREDLRRLALRDGEAFLELEADTARAAKIRRALDSVRRE